MLAFIALIAANACFVAAEFGLVAVDRTRVDERAGQGDLSARRLQGLLDRLSYHLSGLQLGITVTSLALGLLAEPTVAAVISPGLEALFGSVPDGVSIALALLIATVVQMIFGELIPKSLATIRPIETSFALARPTAAYSVVARPVAAVLDGVAARITRGLGVEPAAELEGVADRDEIAHRIRSSGAGGMLDEGEVELLTRSIRLADKSADDAMVPRVRVVAVDDEATIDQLIAVAVETGHSRFPVMGDGLDDLIGVVHVKSVHAIPINARATTQVVEVMAPVLAVPESRDLDDLLVELRAGGQQMAVVIDEHGGTAGIITLEDVLEELVGEIDDEHDEITTSLTRVEALGSTIVPASLHPDEVQAATGFEMPDGEYETLAGLVLDELGQIPTPGDMCAVDGWRLEVVAMDRLRIASVRVVAPAETTP